MQNPPFFVLVFNIDINMEVMRFWFRIYRTLTLLIMNKIFWWNTDVIISSTLMDRIFDICDILNINWIASISAIMFLTALSQFQFQFWWLYYLQEYLLPSFQFIYLEFIKNVFIDNKCQTACNFPLHIEIGCVTVT